MPAGTSSTSVAVWDLSLRLFHWGLLAAVAIAEITAEWTYEPHLWSGYLVFGLILYRLVWGCVGPQHARFADFVRRPGVVFAHLRALAKGSARRHLGHNPAGGAMAVALLAALAATALSGIALDGAENRAGPLGATLIYRHASLVSAIHEAARDLTWFLVAVHVLGVVVTSWLQRENLMLAMVTGRKRRRADPERPS